MAKELPALPLQHCAHPLNRPPNPFLSRQSVVYAPAQLQLQSLSLTLGLKVSSTQSCAAQIDFLFLLSLNHLSGLNFGHAPQPIKFLRET